MTSNAEWWKAQTELEETRHIDALYALPLDHLVVALCSLEKMQVAIYRMQKEGMI